MTTQSGGGVKPADIAFIGLGIMGQAMAANLARAGHRVTLWNRTPERDGIAELVKVTQTPLAKTIAEAVASAQYIFICVSDVPDMEAVLFDEGGVAKSVKEGALVIDTSTTGQKAAQDAALRLSEGKVRFVDAPVTGGDVGAKQGTLTVLVGASPEDFAEVEPVLASIGKGIFHCGPVGSGQAVKLCNQILCAVNMVAVSEALTLASELKVDATLIVEALAGGAGGSWALSNLGARILKSDFAPGFMLKDMLKDLRLVKENLKGTNLSLPGFELAEGLFDEVAKLPGKDGGNRQGTQAMIKAYRKDSTAGMPVGSGS